MNTQEMVTGGQETASLIENSRQPEETLYVDTKLGRTPNAKVLTVPFRTQVWTTKVAPDGTNEVRPTYPNFIKCLEDGRIDDALVSLSIEIRTRLIMALSFKHISLEAPLGVSMQVPRGCFMVDREHGNIIRIIINEAEAEEMACDADGDRASLIWDVERKKAALLKWPFTKRILVLTYIPGKCVEHFTDLTVTNLKKYWEMYPRNRYGTEMPSLPDKATFLVDDGVHYVPQSEKSAFLKGHKAALTGPLTVKFNTADAFKCINLAWQAALVKIGESLDLGIRYDEIELKSMKAARKDHLDHVTVITEDKMLRLQPWLAPFLTSRKSVTRSGQRLEDVMWVFELNPNTKHFKAVEAAKIAWSLKLTKADFIVKKNSVLQPKNYDLKVVDFNLIDRVIKSGYMKVEAFPHFASIHNRVDCAGKSCEHEHTWPKLPFSSDALDLAKLPVISVMLQNSEGVPISLTDTKRDDYNADNGVESYMYLLPPVWNSELSAWVHPLTHLAEWFKTVVYVDEKDKVKLASPFDSTIRTPSGEIVSYFARQTDSSGEYTTYWKDSTITDEYGQPIYRKGEKIDHFRQYPVKAVKFQQALTEYCGQYGYAVRCKRTGLKFTPAPIALDTVSKILTVDYMKDSNEFEMWEHINKANKQIRLCMSGNKQTDRRVRRYYLGRPNGTAIIGSAESHIARPGKSSSQRVRAATELITFRVAIVDGPTKTQGHITPSGVQKQLANCFMTQPLATEKEYLKYCAKNNILPKPSPLTTRIQTTITGERRMSWLVDPKPTAVIGKLVDDNGNKLMPRPISQAWEIDEFEGDEFRSKQIDLIIPLFELAAKGCMRSLLGLNAVPTDKLKTVEIADSESVSRRFKAVIVDLEFFRTGAASENIPARYRMFSADGMDMHIALEGIMRTIPTLERPEPDFDYPTELIMLGRKIIRMYPQYASKLKPY